MLCPSERYYLRRGHPAKKLTDHARQALLQLPRWGRALAPGRRLVVVADSSFAVIRLLAAVREHLTVVARLRLDAALYHPAAPRHKGQIGRPRKRGARQPTLAAQLDDPATAWRYVRMSRWYGQQDYPVEVATGTAVWYHSGYPTVPLRWVLVRDLSGRVDPKGWLSTDPNVTALDTLRWYARRWALEVTFAEVRRHLELETQRQWSPKAISRTTPCLLGLFSVVTLAADALHDAERLATRQSGWYEKTAPTFSDALAAVRLASWQTPSLWMSSERKGMEKIPADVLRRMTSTLAYAA
ncbi:MAG: hypothetical protein AAF809_14835 [Bacteroidota bacterium]